MDSNAKSVNKKKSSHFPGNHSNDHMVLKSVNLIEENFVELVGLDIHVMKYLLKVKQRTDSGEVAKSLKKNPKL